MADGAEGTVKCTVCGKGIPVVLKRQPADDMPAYTALVAIDMGPVQQHMQTCEGVTKPAALAVPKSELSGRVSRFLDTRAFVASGGSRACTMCGTTGKACMDKLEVQPRSPRGACCAACGAGNTHTAPGEAVGSCAQWAAQQGAKS